MSVSYVAEMDIDLGERIHIKSIVKPRCGQDIPFTIHAARWELWDSGGVLESEGECVINGHELDTLIQPQKADSRYTFKYIYEVADEIWVDQVRLKVR